MIKSIPDNSVNSQQYPKDITGIVVPRDNNILFDADYSQIEYRTLVAMANEPKLAELFKDPDTDYHTLMASLMYGVPYASVTPKMRSDAKSFNFGIPYGMGFKSLAILLTGQSGPSQVEEAKEKYELYFKDQPNVRRFFELVKEMAQVNGYTKTYWNRYRYYSFTDKDGKISNAKRAAALRQAGNACIQGCLHGDTKIQTFEHGIVAIKDVVDRHLKVWDGTSWSEGDILYSGKKRKCIVKFSTGQEFICSPIHKFLVKNADSSEVFVECKDLKGTSTYSEKEASKVVINKQYEFSKDIFKDFKYTVENRNLKDAFRDTEKLRDAISSIFELYGIEREKPTLELNHREFDSDFAKDIQKALLFFGIRSNIVKMTESTLIEVESTEEFIQKLCMCSDALNTEIKNESLTITVESVIITDEYIDMYDVCNTDNGYYVADGIITHNTAADIFKISVARNFMWIRNNNLLGKVIIINMVHDEQLMEIDCNSVNVQRALRDIVNNMEFKVEGFPPLYVGAGIGMSWKDAKGKMAEIHPDLANQLSIEMNNTSLTVENPINHLDVLKYFDNRVYQFRLDKVKNYLLDPENRGKELHPVIGGLINLQFTYGLEKQYEGNILTLEALKAFIRNNELPVDPAWFIINLDEHEKAEIEEEDDGYDDDENEDEDLDPNEISDYSFAMIDESDKYFGSSLQDLIREFGLLVSKELKVCGIDVNIMPYKKKDSLIEYLAEHQTDPDTEGAMEVVFLRENNTIFKTGIYVSNIAGSAISAKLGVNTVLYS